MADKSLRNEVFNLIDAYVDYATMLELDNYFGNKEIVAKVNSEMEALKLLSSDAHQKIMAALGRHTTEPAPDLGPSTAQEPLEATLTPPTPASQQRAEQSREEAGEELVVLMDTKGADTPPPSAAETEGGESSGSIAEITRPADGANQEVPPEKPAPDPPQREGKEEPKSSEAVISLAEQQPIFFPIYPILPTAHQSQEGREETGATVEPVPDPLQMERDKETGDSGADISGPTEQSPEIDPGGTSNAVATTEPAEKSVTATTPERSTEPAEEVVEVREPDQPTVSTEQWSGGGMSGGPVATGEPPDPVVTEMTREQLSSTSQLITSHGAVQKAEAHAAGSKMATKRLAKPKKVQSACYPHSRGKKAVTCPPHTGRGGGKGKQGIGFPTIEKKMRAHAYARPPKGVAKVTHTRSRTHAHTATKPTPVVKEQEDTHTTTSQTTSSGLGGGRKGRTDKDTTQESNPGGGEPTCTHTPPPIGQTTVTRKVTHSHAHTQASPISNGERKASVNTPEDCFFVGEEEWVLSEENKEFILKTLDELEEKLDDLSLSKVFKTAVSFVLRKGAKVFTKKKKVKIKDNGDRKNHQGDEKLSFPQTKPPFDPLIPSEKTHTPLAFTDEVETRKPP